MDHSNGLVFRRPPAALRRRAVVYFYAAVLTAGLVRHAPVDAAQAYQLEVRYGLDGRQGRARWAPYIGVESGGGSRQALRLGVTLTVGRRLDAGLELGQRQGAPGADPEHAGQLRATLRW